MKIAVISDVHGNLSALEAVLKDIDHRGVRHIFCLGDIVGKGPNSREAIAICRACCERIVRGNWDYGIYEVVTNMKKGTNEEISERVRWLIEELGSSLIDFMGALPHSTEIYMSGRLIRFFHAHPKNFNRYYEDSPLEKRQELFGYGEEAKEQKQADVAVYGDIHTTYMQGIGEKILLNVGSVGNPLDIPEASYVILEGDEGREVKSNFNIQFVRIPYDIEAVIKVAIEKNIPDLEGYIGELRTAKYFKRS